MPRYELSDGKSHKFWEIERDGDTVVTRHGRIGSEGKTSRKECADEKKAQK